MMMNVNPNHVMSFFLIINFPLSIGLSVLKDRFYVKIISNIYISYSNRIEIPNNNTAPIIKPLQTMSKDIFMHISLISENTDYYLTVFVNKYPYNSLQ